MKLFNLILLISLNLPSNIAYSCEVMKDYVLTGPSYIDPDYRTYYGGNNEIDIFRLLAQQYVNTNEAENQTNDYNARQISNTQEPHRYIKYSKSAKKFNSHAYEEALQDFTELRNTKQSLIKKLTNLFQTQYSWVKEASTYMIARCQLVLAQKKWDGYSDTSDIDQNMLKKAEESYQLYLREYPDGLYANSAKNIRRKILLLSNREQDLIAELKKLPTPPYININRIDELIRYFDGKIDITKDHPVLIAYKFIIQNQTTADDIPLLKAREQDFSSYPGLLTYLQTYYLYKIEKYQELIDLTANEPITKDIVSLSTQILRARALLHLNKIDDAMTILQKMHQASPEDAIEVEIAYLKINRGDGLWFYGPQNIITKEYTLRYFAYLGFTNEELEKGLDNKDIIGAKRRFIVDELSRRYAFTKDFQKLSSLLVKEEDIKSFFAPLKSSAITLAKDDSNLSALVEMGSFLYQNGISVGNVASPNNQEPMDDNSDALMVTDAITVDNEIYNINKCSTCKQFFERYKNTLSSGCDYFNLAANIAEKTNQRGEDEAKALSYLAVCMKPFMYYYNESSHKKYLDISNSAFKRLKTLYKDSPWVQKAAKTLKEKWK